MKVYIVFDGSYDPSVQGVYTKEDVAYRKVHDMNNKPHGDAWYEEHEVKNE